MDIKAKHSNYILRSTSSRGFINDIAKIPVLTKEEERNLFVEYEKSMNRLKAAEGASNYMEVKEVETKIQDDIRKEVISRNQRFNLAVAKRYCGDNRIMDLINVGVIGMHEAFNEYNYKKDNRFCSYAIWYIRRAINAYLIKENLTVKTSNGSLLLGKVKKIEEKFFAKEGRYPSENELKALLEEKYNITNADANDFHKILTSSIDSQNTDSEDDYNPVNHEFSTRTAAYNDYEKTMVNEDLAFRLNMAMKSLPERERIIMCMSAGYGYIKEYKDYEIAEELDMTPERVRQIRHNVREKLMAKLSAYAY